MLEKIVFLLQQKKKSEFIQLEQELENVGIQATFVISDNETKEFLHNFTIEEREEKGILFVCDKEEQACFLKEKNMPVIVVLTSYNRRQNFDGFLYAVEGLGEIESDFFVKVWQRFHKIPWTIGETKRCIIREMGTGDLQALYQLYEDPKITEYMEGLFEDTGKELDYIEKYIQNIYTYYGFGTWLIIEKESGQLIGRAGYNYRPGFREVELGFVIGVPYWRKGYAYEVCSYILELGKTAYEFDTIQALTDERNEASKGLLKKLNFHYIEDVTLEQGRLQRYIKLI